MPERLQTPCSPISAPSGSAGEPPTPPGGTQAAPTARLPLTCTEPFPREQAGSKLCCLGFYYLFIRTYEKKKKNQKHFHTLSRSGAGERKEGGKGYKTGPRGREEAALCPPYARLHWEEGGESRWGLRHRWHKAADDQQNGLLERGDEKLPRPACSWVPAELPAACSTAQQPAPPQPQQALCAGKGLPAV